MAFSPDVYVRALTFAAQAHGAQQTPTGLPYIVHVSCVATELICALREEAGHDEALAVTVALLHDVLEDTQVTPGELEREFGAPVAAAVRALTKNKDLPKEERMEDSLRRIQEQPKEVALVKLADRITNLAPPPATWTAWKIGEYKKEAQRIFDALHSASPSLARRFEERLGSYGRASSG